MIRKAVITAMGKYAPEKILTNRDLEEMVDTNDEWIVARTGIRERHIAGDGVGSSDLAYHAFRNLQENYDVDPASIDQIVFTTVTPDMVFPMASSLLQHKIGAKNAWGFDLNAACSSYLFGLEHARQAIASGSAEKVLVVGADKMTSIVDYSDRNTCILFGDAAAVTLVEATNDEEYGIIDSQLHLDGIGADFLYMKAGGSLLPASHETVDNGSMRFIRMAKPYSNTPSKEMADVAEEVVRRNGLSGDDIAMLIPHQANLRIIDGTAKRLGLPAEKSHGKY
jgi:3-oxoacyl-[acyl-carrier-protein] synthase-3